MQKLSLAYGLARYDQVDTAAIIDGLIDEETEPDEVDNIVTAFRMDESESLEVVRDAAKDASNASGWPTKARLAIVALHLGDDSLAAEMLRDGPETTVPKVELPDLIADFRKQIEQINDLPEEQRTSQEQRLKLAVAHYFLDQDEQALVEFEQLVSGNSANWEVWLRRAICEARVGKAEDARESLKQLADVTRTQSLIAYANILVEAWLGNLEEAEEKLDELIAGSSEDSVAQYNAACIAAQLVRVCRQKDFPGEERFKKLALQRLRSAYADLGYSGPSGSEIATDPDFIPLRQDTDFLALVGELKPPKIPFDPIQRTVFIREFAEWSGSVGSLAGILAGTNNPALRSGICLALGSVKKPSQESKEAWRPILQRWYSTATDSGTHSSARLALSRWNLEMPEIVASKEEPSDRDWWHGPHGIRFVKIEAGTVTGKGVLIQVHDDFWLGDTEITVGLFRQFMADEEYHKKHPELKPDWDGPRIFNNDDSDDLPVHRVSWYDSVMFCNWLSEELGLDPCYDVKKKGARDYAVKWQRDADGIRLPTEAEWEYACRASTTTRFGFGDEESDLSDYGWYASNSNSRTHLIGTKLCNVWGLFDMHGNVYEWCWDTDGSDRWYRGGAYHVTARRCLSSLWSSSDPISISNDLGFRVAQGPSSSASPASE